MVQSLHSRTKHATCTLRDSHWIRQCAVLLIAIAGIGTKTGFIEIGGADDTETDNVVSILSTKSH